MLEVPPKKVGIIPLYDPDETPGGIIIPDVAKTRSDQGIVKYVGTGMKWLKPGDWVLFSPLAGEVLDLEDEGKLLIIPEALIVAVIQDADEFITDLYMKQIDGTYIPTTWAFATRQLARTAYHMAQKYRMNPHPSKYRDIEARARQNEELINVFAEDDND
jgi:chaperonin GroES